MVLYVKRNEKGDVIALSSQQLEGYERITADEAMDVFKHLYPDAIKMQVTHELHHTDTEMIRVIEDLVELLIAKNIIQLTELPRAAQQKIYNRKKIRRLLSDAIIPDDKIETI